MARISDPRKVLDRMTGSLDESQLRSRTRSVVRPATLGTDLESLGAVPHFERESPT